ncbi:MAG: helix-turn-helix domain-containing protein [Puniceicoccales bacterium]|jgi:transcriptional regulator with XRE-family HTH domain|nr:helix-turn-helix domain-containing protein [Puniceicoccales bacterium]
MSDNIGNLFSETRKRKGISLEEAAEMVHIKAEYLEAIENGSFDFILPDIYKRGFYKTYAGFLGLNVEEIMAKCPIKPFETLESSQKRREMVSQVAKKSQKVNHENLKTSFSDDVNEISISPSEPKLLKKIITRIRETITYIRETITLKTMGAIGLAVVLVSLLLYMIIGMVSHPSPQMVAVVQENVEPVQKKITIRASGDIKVMVRVENNKEKLFSGTLQKGNEKIVTYTTPIQIYFDRGEFLVIELTNGEYLHPDSGRGGIQIK